ncbi:uncharacterized protein LOC108328450 isoform X2 [Vigna angularis]|uniref:uncharacterized protein LOC108328450 isoform X2 n=1 Tax=Phaseolus angularis TaxID=3914 RepID=UPI0022B2FEF0|nr:uncharacterized protein LOC108328450 isoform X2 [Vigna angularis]
MKVRTHIVAPTTGERDAVFSHFHRLNPNLVVFSYSWSQELRNHPIGFAFQRVLYSFARCRVTVRAYVNCVVQPTRGE